MADVVLGSGQELEYAELLRVAPDALIVADRDGTIRLWNAAAERIFGHAAEAAVGANLDLIIPERFRDGHWAGFERALESGDLRQAGRALPTRSAHADGRTIYVELTFALLHAGGAEVAGVLCAARDITERMERERAQRAQARAAEG
jgi:PAS domain S-box-containing protein